MNFNYKAAIRSKNFAFFVVLLGTFMSSLDASVVNIALPSISRYFGAGITKVQWIITIYGLGVVALLPLGSKLGNKYGQNKINALGYFLFGLGSLLCGASQNLPCLVLSRLAQATGAAMMFALSQGIVASIFTGVKRGGALGLIGACVALGNITGPSLGGLLLDSFGWQSIFYINLPIAAFGVYYSYIALPSVLRTRLGVIKPAPVFYFIAASALFITALSLAETAGWQSPHILVMLAGSVFFAAVLYRHESRANAPLINLSLYSNKVFAFGNCALVLVFVGGAINAVLIPFYLQDIYGLSAFKTGLLILFFSVSMIITAPLSGRLSGKIGSRGLTVAGNALTIIGMLWYMNLGAAYREWQIIAGQLILGIGNGMFQSPNNNSIMSSVQRRFYNDASGLNAIARNIGIVTGVTLTVNVFDALRSYFLTEGYATQPAFIKAYHYTLVAGIVMVFASLLLSYFGKAPDKKPKQPPASEIPRQYPI
jgi:EmrB/QacA subfamily drug resistance transporter